jgi:ABC-type polysaccharide transport system permease subunit
LKVLVPLLVFMRLLTKSWEARTHKTSDLVPSFVSHLTILSFLVISCSRRVKNGCENTCSFLLQYQFFCAITRLFLVVTFTLSFWSEACFNLGCVTDS